jgi:hypothetical protein
VNLARDDCPNNRKKQVARSLRLRHIAEVAKRNALLGSPAKLFFWRTRAQSEVDLVVKQASGLQAFEIKWSPRRVSGRAFCDAYGVEVEPIRPESPFTMDPFKAATADRRSAENAGDSN